MYQVKAPRPSPPVQHDKHGASQPPGSWQHLSQGECPQAPWHEVAVHQVLFPSNFGFLPREEPGGELRAGLSAGLVRAGMPQTLCWGAVPETVFPH